MLEEDDDLFIDDDFIELKVGTLQLQGYEDTLDSSQNHSVNDDGTIPWLADDPKSFLCNRDGLLENAINEISSTLTTSGGDVIGAWLLTEVSFWDNEKERILLLSSDGLLVVKYDFIGLKILDYYAIPLSKVDTIVIGDLVYPSVSLAPHVDGMTSYLSKVVNAFKYKFVDRETSPDNVCGVLSLKSYKPSSKSVVGIRIMWNGGKPLSFTKKWNPFCNDIPWSTFTSHPLLWHTGNERQRLYDVEKLASRLVKAVQKVERSTMCNIQHTEILLQNYFGIFSVIHNRNSLGFFKVRGRFSF